MGPTARQDPYDLYEDLSHDVMKEPNMEAASSSMHMQKCPMLLISILRVPVPALIDSGSQITCISEAFYTYLLQHKKIPEFPVKNVLLLTAIGKKVTRIKKQVLLEVKIGDYSQSTSFLVVPGLTSQIILGNEWLLNNKVMLDYKHHTVTLDGYCVPAELSLYGRSSFERVLSSDKDNLTVIQIITSSEIGINITNFESLEGGNCNSVLRKPFSKEIHTQTEGVSVDSHTNNETVLCHDKFPLIKQLDDQISDKREVDYLNIKNDKDPSKKVEHNIVFENKNDFFDNLQVNEIDVFRTLFHSNDFQLGNPNQYCQMIDQAINDDLKFENEQNRLDVRLNLSTGNSQLNVQINDVIIVENELNEQEKTQFDFMYSNKIYSESDDDAFLNDVRSVAESLTTCDSRDRRAFVDTFYKFKKLFSHKDISAGNYEYSLKIKPHKTFVHKTYPVPLKYRDAVELEIERMIRAGIIERSTSSYCNPLRIVQRSDGNIRICLDARFINNIIESENEAPPRISDILQKFHGIKYISTSDLANGYWQIPLHRDSRQYTAFVHNSRVYHFCRIPFGLKTAGSGFIRALNFALGSQCDAYLTAYVDDLLITTAGTFSDHLKDLVSVFSILQSQNFTLRLDKSLFCRESVKYLGFRLSLDGIQPDPDKLEIIRDFSEPENRTHLQSFLGRCNYYRQFVARYSGYLDPFRDILKESNRWTWTAVHKKAFRELKNNLADCIMLKHYIPNIPFKLQTDASSKGISGVLFQVDEKGNQYVITLVSRCLSIAESHYSTTELELLSIVYSVLKCRTYLLGSKFEIITDHQALTFLNKSSFHSSRLIRWSMILQQFDFEIKYCTGRENIIADFFSRNPSGKFEESERKTLIIHGLLETLPINIREISLRKNDMYKIFCNEFRNIRNLQDQDKNIKLIKDKLNNNNILENYTLHQGVVFRKDHSLNNYQLVLPSGLVDKIVDQIHTKLGHPGYYKTLMYVRQFFYWKGMSSMIKNL